MSTRVPRRGGELTREYLARYPKMDKRWIARKLRADHPDVFISTEKARSHVRYWTGCNGSNSRSDLASAKGKGIPTEYQKAHLEIAQGWPDEVEQWKWQPYQIPALDGVYLILADTHIPFQCNRAVETAVAWAKKTYRGALKGIILNGDIMDQYWSSWWTKNVRLCKPDAEIAATCQWLQHLIKLVTPEVIIYKEANHEVRFRRYIESNPVAGGVEVMCRAAQLENLLELDKLDTSGVEFKVVEAGNFLWYRNFSMLHGDEIKATSNIVNPARTAFLRTKSIVLVAHSHQSSTHVETTLRGEQMPCWSMGSLCNLHPQWYPLAHLKWNHGFAVLDVRKSWELRNLRIVNEKEVVNA